jgi:hypothetical protein
MVGGAKNAGVDVMEWRKAAFEFCAVDEKSKRLDS